MLIVALLLLGVPFLNGAAGDISFGTYFSTFVLLSAGAVGTGIWFFRYRVEITNNNITIGAFRGRTIPFAQIAAYNTERISQSAYGLANARLLFDSSSRRSFSGGAWVKKA